MKRLGVWLGGAFLASVIAGCEGGLSEGPPAGTTPQSAQPAGFQAEMEKNAGKMGVSKKQSRPPKNAPETKPGP
jgi:hypothetical protein